VDDKETLSGLLEGFTELGKDVPVIFPAHPRTVRNIEEMGLASRVRTGPPACEPGIWVLPPAGYLEFLHLLSEASIVLTDSGGIQEETTALGVPCLTLRENTERPITVDEGTNLLVGRNPVNILSAAREILAGRGKKGRIPQSWDGRTAERIVNVLTERPPKDSR
jgi:UDP-N-acetylglucosamine 2-epimerase (non-hydrolysing)